MLSNLHAWRSNVLHRYPTKDLLIQCLTRLWESAGIGDGDRCSKIFIGKPSGATAGVEGLFSNDGIQYGGVFQVARESAADAVDILAHRQVRTCCLQAWQQGVPFTNQRADVGTLPHEAVQWVDDVP